MNHQQHDGEQSQTATARRTAEQLARMRERAWKLIHGETPTGSRPDIELSRPVTDGIENLSPRALHRLEAMLGRTRHSAVKSCFYNLNLYAGMLASDKPPDRIEEKIGRALAGLEDAALRIGQLLAERLDGGRTVGEIFPEQARRIGEGIAALEPFARRAASGVSGGDAPLGAEDGPVIQRQVELVSRQLALMQERIDGCRALLETALTRAVAAERPLLEAAGVELEIRIEEAGRGRFFIAPSFEDAVAELLRNAAVHGFDPPDRRAGPPRPVVTLAAEWADPNRRTARVTIRDNGRGIAAEALDHVGRRGFTTGPGAGEGLALVRQIIEKEHLAELKIESGAGQGALVTVELPVKADLEKI